VNKIGWALDLIHKLSTHTTDTTNVTYTLHTFTRELAEQDASVFYGQPDTFGAHPSTKRHR
jgi:hypothetical protein